MPDIVDLHCLTWGSGTKRALLLHGVSSDAGGWWRVGPDLADLGYSVTAPDMRGHGGSPHADDYRLEAYRDDVLALGDGWDLVLGHSLGGAVALLCQLAHPPFARRMVLADPVVEVRDPDEALEWLMAPFTKPITVAEIAGAHPRWHPEDVRFKVGALVATTPEVLERTIRENHREFGESVTQLDIPTLIIGADPEIETLVTPEMGRQYAAANPLIAFTWLEGAGHSIHRERYEAFWALVTDFLG